MNKKLILILITVIIIIIGVSSAYCTGLFPNTYSKFTHTEDFGNFTMEIPNDVSMKLGINNTYETTTNDKFRVSSTQQEEAFGINTFDVLINYLNKNESVKSINSDLPNNCRAYEIVKTTNFTGGKYLVISLVEDQVIMIICDDLDVIKKSLETVKVKTTPKKEVSEPKKTVKKEKPKSKDTTTTGYKGKESTGSTADWFDEEGNYVGE